jgi:hypothetical protein
MVAVVKAVVTAAELLSVAASSRAGMLSGVDSLAFAASTVGARYATASSLPRRPACADHRSNRATVGSQGFRHGQPLARDPPLTRQILHHARLNRGGGACLRP